MVLGVFVLGSWLERPCARYLCVRVALFVCSVLVGSCVCEFVFMVEVHHSRGRGLLCSVSVGLFIVAHLAVWCML